MRQILRRSAAAVLLVLLLALTACTRATAPDSMPGPETQLAAFVAAWQKLDAGTAADLTSDPAAATLVLDEVANNLDPDSMTIAASPTNRIDAESATTPVIYTWTFADKETWSYPATWSWKRDSDAQWRLSWAPSVVHPTLSGRQTLSVRRSQAQQGALVDRNNVQVAAPVRVFSVVMKAAGPAVAPTAAALAPVLAATDRTVTEDSIVAGAAQAVSEATGPQDTSAAATAANPDPSSPARSSPAASSSASGTAPSGPAPSSSASGTAPVDLADVTYTVINLREREYGRLQPQLARIAGVTFPSEVRDLPPTKDFGKAVLPELTAAAAATVTGTPGWKVTVVDSTGGALETLADHPAVPGSRVVLTLDGRLQQRAEAILAPVTQPAAMVVMQPSTGEILTVAQNRAANAQGSIALTGQYPPGSTFKVVTATAGLDAGLIKPGKPTACPAIFTVDGREIHNSHDFDLGTVDSTLAFARSCNTTFASVARQLGPDALTVAASDYGIGLDFVIPGATTLTGKVPAAASAVQHAENGFGQGQVLLTPFSAALMAATAANGTMPTPTLIRGTTTTVDRKPAVRPAAVQQGIQTYLQAVVQQGTARELQRFGDVHAKTGTAEFTAKDGTTHAHAWTVGYLDDLAFAALVVGGESSSLTNKLCAQLLETLPT